MKENQEIAKDYTDWMVKTGGYARDMTLRDHLAGLAMQDCPLSLHADAAGGFYGFFKLPAFYGWQI